MKRKNKIKMTSSYPSCITMISQKFRQNKNVSQ